MATRIRLNISAMRGFRRPVSCRSLGRQYQRFNSTNPGYGNQTPFWTTNKVLLLSAFTGALAYTYGLWDAGASYKKDGLVVSQKPVYAKKAEWERVSLLLLIYAIGHSLILVLGNRGSKSQTW
jgi:D-lactate dehydrogenase (cytochrome)